MASSTTASWSAPELAGAQHPGQRLAGGVGEAEHGVEAVAALEVAGRSLLVGRVDLDQGRVDVEDRLGLGADAEGLPHPRPGRRSGPAQGVEHDRVDLVDGPPDRRRGGHLPEQVGLVAQRRHVVDAHPASGQGHGHLGQQPPPVLPQCALAAPRHRRRIGGSEPGSIGDITEKVQPHEGGHLVVTLGHHHPLDGPCSVHFGSALLGWVLRVSTTAVSLAGRAFSRTGGAQRLRPGEGSGLGVDLEDKASSRSETVSSDHAPHRLRE
jgi:hypothetical protein